MFGVRASVSSGDPVPAPPLSQGGRGRAGLSAAPSGGGVLCLPTAPWFRGHHIHS